MCQENREMGRLIVYIIGALLGLTACSEGVAYQVEGKLSNLTEPTVYAVFESEGKKWVDTVQCKTDGSFELMKKEGDFQMLTLFFNGRSQWITLFLEPGKKIKLSGDAQYPMLFHLKGGDKMNERLADFRNSAANLWKEQADLSRKIAQAQANPIEEADLMAKLTNTNHQLEEQGIAYIKKHPDEAASLALIQYFFTNPDDTREVDELLPLISPDLRTHFLYTALEDYSARAKRTNIGAEAPTFDVKNIYGEEVDLAQVQDKYVLLTFTAPWCEPDEPVEDPYLKQIVQRYEKEELDLIVVTLDENPNALRELVRQDSVAWNLVSDSAGQASALIDLYNVNELPRCFLIDKDKKILLKTENNLEIRDALEELFEP